MNKAIFKNGYVYIAESEFGIIKIGKTTNPKLRFKTLELQSGNKIINFYVTELCCNYSELEIQMHDIFKKYRKIGEWFNLDFKIAVNKIKTLKLITSQSYTNNRENKNTMIGFRATEEEKEFLQTIANDKGMNLSEYIRYCVYKEMKGE